MVKLAEMRPPDAAKLARDPKACAHAEPAAPSREARNVRRLGPGGAGYFEWPAAARARTGRDAMALRGRLIAEQLVRALGNRRRS